MIRDVKPFLVVLVAISLALVVIKLLLEHHHSSADGPAGHIIELAHHDTTPATPRPVIIQLPCLPDNLVPFKKAAAKTNVKKELRAQVINLETCHAIFTPKLDNESSSAVSSTPSNIVLIFTGRWFFLRIQLPQIIRELRQNGGIIDKVWFVMIKWTGKDYKKLREFAKIANELLQDEVFTFHNYEDYNIHMPKPYTYAYCEILANLLKYPLNRYFKIDDDVVYIHPKVFDRMIENKNKQDNKCLLNLVNTAGGNWMCNKMYQDKGVLGEVDNPDHIDFHKVHGEGKLTSTKYALNLFLHFLKTDQIDKIFLESMFWNKRYTFNAAMLDADTFDYDRVKKAGPLKPDRDEPWWTKAYPSVPLPGNRSNCITGDTVIVHFSHSGGGLALRIIAIGLLDKFEDLVKEQRKKGVIKMGDELWNALGYESTL